MDWGALSPAEVARVDGLAPQDPERLLARLEGAFGLRHSDPPRACRIAAEVLEAAEAAGERRAAARARVVANYTVGEGWDPDVMLEGLERAFEELLALGDDWGLARAGDLLAFIYENMGDYPTVLRYTQAALDASRRARDPLFEANALSSMAGVLIAADDQAGAHRHLEQALAIATRIGSARLEGRLLLRRARLEREMGQPKASLQTLTRAHAAAVRADNPYSMVDALGQMARTHETVQAWDLAQDLYEKAIRSLRGEMRAMMAPPQLVGLARVHLACDRPRAALVPLEEVTVLGRRYNMVPVLTDATKLLAEALARLGEHAKAYEALGEHLELRETMMRGQAQRAVKRLQVKADLEAAKKDAEIHRLKYVELQTMQSQLLESERLAAVGTLTAGVTHEMNTPLGVVKSGLDTQRRALQKLQVSLPEAPSRAVKASAAALDSAVATSTAAVARLESLVSNLRRFTRLDEAEYQALDVREELQTTLQLLAPQLPPGIHIETELSEVPIIQGWPSALNQAFLTLLSNAAEALGTEGRIRVACEARDQGRVQVTIADDGPGIADDVKARLFDLELSRDGARARFRVGLATVKTVVARHHGRIEVDSQPGQGAAFTISLPVVQG